jgi:hypothetical protein
MKFAAILVGALVCSACGNDSSPLNPSGTDNTAALHVNVDGTTCTGLGPVTVSIDGTTVGNAQPGGNGITKEVAVGAHYVGGRAVNYDYSWTPVSVTVQRGGFTYLLYCRF